MLRENPHQTSVAMRATHFLLGKENGKPESIYISHYTPKKAEQEKAVSQLGTIGLRATHFQIGHMPIDNTVTQYSHEYFPKKADLSHLDPNRVKDLRSSHFTFGSFPRVEASVSKQSYQPQTSNPNETKRIQQEMTSRMRMHYATFGSAKPDYESQTAFVHKPLALSTLDPKKMKDQANELRATHFIFGKMDPPLLTTNKIQFTDKSKQVEPREQQNHNLQTTHFLLGPEKENPIVSSTMLQYPQYYNAKPSKLNEEVLKDLRSSHIIMGKEAPDYKSEFKANYVKLPEGYRTEKLGGNIRQSHFQIGDPTLKPDFDSVYASTINDKGPAQPYQKPDPTTLQSHFSLGLNDHRYLISEAADNYKPHNKGEGYDPNDLNAINEMKKDHFDLGYDPNFQGAGNYISVAAESYYKKGEGRQQLNQARKDDLRYSHFILGNESEKIYSSHQADYRPKNTKIEAQVLSDNSLRASHFDLGPEKNNMITEFMDAYRDTRIPNKK